MTNWPATSAPAAATTATCSTATSRSAVASSTRIDATYLAGLTNEDTRIKYTSPTLNGFSSALTSPLWSVAPAMPATAPKVVEGALPVHAAGDESRNGAAVVDAVVHARRCRMAGATDHRGEVNAEAEAVEGRRGCT